MPSSTSQPTVGSGEPGCQTLEEVNRMFRHFFDPTRYWQCEAQGRPAQLRQCPQNQLFLDQRGKCVNYTDWHWTDPTEPLSQPVNPKTS